MKVTSGAIAVADHGGNFRFEHHDILNESLDDKYFKKENIFKIIIQLDYLNLNMVLKLNQRPHHLQLHLFMMIKLCI